ncbi:nitrilase-related carbon-nitrogen hydrolase, partial [Mesorhizobium sp.]|uniref:nitrilase-related carbon-nitrogen hydrolase n=1 Tax=Mesorhizobium sp. TaxID=1871066 RepID=UPI0025E56BDD
MGVFKAAAIQMRSGESPERNAVDLEWLVREAAGLGATYIQTPEMTGALIRDKEARAASLTSEDKDIVVTTARKLSSELGVFLHIGSTAILRADGKLANRALLFGPDGATLATYDKIHMFDVDLDNGESWRESAAYEPGTEAVVTEIEGAKLG